MKSHQSVFPSAPVSSVWLASECLSQGEKRVSCSSAGGDSPQYSWTLDGRSLTDTELLSHHSETTRLRSSGLLVRNNVSQVSKGEEISNCGFIFINCSSNGTQISQWVFAANNTLCVEPTTTSPTTIIPESSTAGLETYCDSRQDGAQCFGPLGGTVVLQLIDRALQTERYKLYKSSNETTVILFMMNNEILYNAIQSRSSFNPSDGKFRVNNLSRNDSAEYKFEISDGINIKEKRALQLTIQAPVSSVRLASECLSQGEKRVSCSSGGGDSPQYSWTLDGRSLTDTELLSVNTKTNSITLRQHVSGAVACSVGITSAASVVRR
ncbi:hypothetical protein F7725_010031 [Dissostichus mawsoni]|uniref:Ig-like domain-containing protein n=1 Tax=Dissostichus mawsoni TaxID=36200 RepID=A0A7J5XN42_DISMA|nr:hypothetical protein F7725_010031 [Dissostichus mawsoni]